MRRLGAFGQVLVAWIPETSTLHDLW
jgi:hypothetical protein